MTTHFAILDESPSVAQLEMARGLVREYAALPHTVGRWSTASADIAALPAPFVHPRGVFVIAMDNAHAIGCGAVLQLEPGIAEMKRLYVRPAARGRGIGEALVKVLLDHAAALGCSRVRLDTAPELQAAQALYRRLGFQPIAPYRAGLLADAVCFELTLGVGPAIE